MSKGACEPVLPRALFMALWCALVVLLVTMVISTFVTEFTFISGYIALWKSFLRFLRLSANLALPLLLLPPISSLLQPVLNGFRRRLVRAEKPAEQESDLKYVLLRPFQGIGLSMLFATKLLIFLQVYTGTKAGAATMLPSGHFALARFAAASIIGILVSITLSFLWTLDDLGIRHYNEKTEELRLAGKYLGMLLPVVFGFYGILEILEDIPRIVAARYIGQMVIALYPPFVLFEFLHALYLRRYGGVFLRRLKISGERKPPLEK